MVDENGIVTCHGFTGYPEEVAIIGEAFVEEGFVWRNIVLPGHTTDERALRKTTWRDWTGEVMRTIDELASNVEGAVVMSGLSLGGLLTLYAAEHNANLRAIVPLAAPIKVFQWYHRILANILPGFWVKNSDDIMDSDAMEIHRSYPRFHTDSAKQVNALAVDVRKDLSSIAIPALIVHGLHDNSVSPTNATAIFNEISSEMKELLWAENSAHVLTRDYDKQMIVDAALKFVNNALGI